MKSIDGKTNVIYNNPYSLQYRIFKTLLMIFAWISFGLNNQLLTISLEDLKILLNADYKRVSVATIARVTSYMFCSSFSGLILDKFNKRSEYMMAIAKFFMILRKLKLILIEFFR